MFDRFHPKYLVPNVVTGASLILGMIAIVQASRGAHESAAWLIVWCALLDRADGFLARLVDAQSNFGVQFDSLADLLAFGVAPAMFVHFLLSDDPRYLPMMETLPVRAAVLAAVGAYVVSGAARLARFNVQTQRIGPGWSRGLPVPIAGGIVATFVLAAWELGLPPWIVVVSPVVLLVASVLMVSNLWLPRSLGGGRRALALQAVGAVAIYGCGITRTFPTFLLAVAIAYPTVGFLVGYLRPPPAAAHGR
jgi:CDP-diacylglycerol--serine O-phosphatidyltransferase